jgi:hypothetical protein
VDAIRCKNLQPFGQPFKVAGILALGTKLLICVYKQPMQVVARGGEAALKELGNFMNS